MFVVVGLGNTGGRYEKTRHNAGWILLDALLGDVIWSHDGMANAHIYIDAVAGHEVMYVKPLTMMNRSGETIAYLMKQYNVTPDCMMVLHDELDLSVGQVKISHNRGHGGNNGVRSIHQHIGGKHVARMRIGISHLTDEEIPRRIKTNVLGDFNAQDMQKIKGLAQITAHAIKIWIERGVEHAMNQINEKSSL